MLLMPYHNYGNFIARILGETVERL